MPHVNGSGGDDLASSDEVKVFTEEGEREEEQRSSENLTEVKSDLVTESEEDKTIEILPGQSYLTSKSALRTEPSAASGKSSDTVGHDRPLNMGYIVTPYPYPNGTAAPIPVSMANKVGMVPPTHPTSPLSFVMYNEHFGQPPPAHMGIPPVHIDPKTGIPRPPMYPLPTPGQYPHPMFTPDFAQWHTPGMYPITSGAGFRGAYPSLSVTTAGLPRFSHAGLLPAHPGLTAGHPGIPHPAIVTPGPKQDLMSAAAAQENHLSYFFLPALGSANGVLYNTGYHGNQLPSNPSTPSPDLAYQLSPDLRNMKPSHLSHDHRHSSFQESKTTSSHSTDSKSSDSSDHVSGSNSKKKGPGHIKKPLNAFMLYMKEMRAKVVAECTLKESAAINQILGRRWHALGREEQAKYYELARKERQLHMQLYPGWSARDNYAQQCKKKKRKRDKSLDGEGSNPKKCRARFGLDQQSSWCKPCRRKKKCIRYVDGSDGTSIDIDDNLGSVGSSGDIGTPDSKSMADSDIDPHNSEMSLSSPPVAMETPEPKPCPVGSNPHDVNNPLSISSLTGQCTIKKEPEAHQGTSLEDSPPTIASVT